MTYLPSTYAFNADTGSVVIFPRVTLLVRDRCCICADDLDEELIDADIATCDRCSTGN